MNKSYAVKVFDRNAQYITIWKDVNIGSFFKAINGGLGELTLELPKKFDNFDEGASVAVTNIVEVWVKDRDTPGKLLYSGYISGYRISVYEATERVVITCLGFISIYSKLIYKTGTQVSLPHTSTDPTTIAKDVVTKIRAEYSDDAIATKINYSAESTELTGDSVDYTFDSYFGLHAIERALDLSPETFYFHIGADNILYFRKYPASPTHYFTFKKDFRALEVYKNIETVTNNLLFWNGNPGIRPVYIKLTASNGTTGAVGNDYVYANIVAGGTYTFVTGDYIEYDVVWTKPDSFIGFDIEYVGSTYFRSSSSVDQNGLAAHVQTDISKYAHNKVYHRKFAVAAGDIGKQANQWLLACEKDGRAIRTGYIANILVTNGAGTTRHVIYNDAAPLTGHSINVATTGSTITEITHNTIPPISSLYTNEASKAAYGYRFAKDADNRITDQTTANRWGTAYVNRNKNIEIQATVEILDNNIGRGGYDIESIEPGHTCKLLNLPTTTSSTFTENMVIISVDYRPDSVILELGSAAALLEKKMTNIKRTLENSDYAAGQPSYTQTLV